MSRPARIDPATGRLEQPRTVTIHRSTVTWGSVALLLFWIWTTWSAYDVGRTDRAVMVARDAEDRAHAASVGANR